MNKEQFKQNLHRHVKIQPAMQLYDGKQNLRGAVDDAWIVVSISEAEFQLQNRATGHQIALGFDSCYGYHADPGAKATQQTDGILVLKVQLYMFEGALRIASTPMPGKALVDFVPPTTRPNLLATMKALQASEALEAMRHAFDHGQGIAEAIRVFGEIGDVVVALQSDLRSAGYEREIKCHKHRGNGYIMWACGWFLTVEWQAGGTLKDIRLVISKWHGQPNVPGVQHSFDQAKKKKTWEYRYGISRPDDIGWIAPGSDDVSYSTRDVLENVLTDLCAQPNKEPAPVWNLP